MNKTLILLLGKKSRLSLSCNTYVKPKPLTHTAFPQTDHVRAYVRAQAGACEKDIECVLRSICVCMCLRECVCVVKCVCLGACASHAAPKEEARDGAKIVK